MDPTFEQDIPLPAVVAGFVVLVGVSHLVRNISRKKRLIKEGQLSSEDAKHFTVEQRLAGNRSWSSGVIVSRGRTVMIVLGIAALAWNLTIGTAFIKSFSNPTIKTGPFIVLGIFTLIGLVFAAFAVRLSIRFFRYGESSCCIYGKAGVLGKPMTGVVRTTNDIEATGDYSIELQCLETYTTGSGKNRKTEVQSHWQSKQQVPHLGKSSRVGIPFSFDLPKFPPETGYQLSRGSISWQLKIHAPVKGVDYAANFTVPVFKID